MLRKEAYIYISLKERVIIVLPLRCGIVSSIDDTIIRSVLLISIVLAIATCPSKLADQSGPFLVDFVSNR